MNRITKAPGRYIQGEGLLGRLGELLGERCPERVLCVADPLVCARYGALLEGGFKKGQLVMVELTGPCTEGEARRLGKLAREKGAGLILGAGGGRALDTAKAAGYFSALPSAAAPTAASSDAPCSALAVLYTADGRMERYLHLDTGPVLVAADLTVIGSAPPRLLAAGMGDALSTWFEARACQASGGLTDAGGRSSALGLAAARGCWELLMGEGLQALSDLAGQRLTPAVADMVECCLSLSGMGFESGGLAAAHGLANAISGLGLTGAMHGETVAFCTLCQLRLEGAPELAEALSFCREAGLPASLAELGIPGPVKERAEEIAGLALSDRENPIHHMPFPLSREAVASAVASFDR